MVSTADVGPAPAHSQRSVSYVYTPARNLQYARKAMSRLGSVATHGIHMIRHLQKNAWLACLVVAAAVTVLVYKPGLDADLYLDSIKLYQLERLHAEKGGDIEARDLSFWQAYGRVLSQLTFYANIALDDGVDASSIRWINLMIHMLNAVLVFVLLSALLELTRFREQKVAIAGLVAAIWLISSTNASSVLYAIQRMNQLAATFSLSAMVLYVYVRRISPGRLSATAKAAILLPGIGVLSLLAVLCKENALLIPVFILLIEMYLFPDLRQRMRSTQSRIVVSIGAAAAAVPVLWLVASIGMLDYETQTFTLYERVLTESRIVWQYIVTLVLPVSGATGLYQDGFPLSVGLFTPLSTVIAVAGLIALITFVLWHLGDEAYRPVAFGVGFFLAGHALESTVFPLELYYEHRNYLPSVGLYLALVLLVSHLAARFGARQLAVLAIVYIAFMAAMTHTKAVTWSNPRAAYELALERNYLSPRAAGQLSQIYLEDGNPLQALDLLQRVSDAVPDSALRARLQSLFVACAAGLPADSGIYERLPEITGRELDIEVSQALSNIVGIVTQQQCEAVDLDRLISGLKSISRSLRDDSRSSWHIDYYSAGLYATADQQRAADWLAERFLDGEEFAGRVLLDLLAGNDGIVVDAVTQTALQTLGDSG